MATAHRLCFSVYTIPFFACEDFFQRLSQAIRRNAAALQRRESTLLSTMLHGDGQSALQRAGY
ncbi:hypothetical protein [Desulfovibrio sp. ZJ200]|uniref:hypothetical protein n=1 Tax=Desulfovibrio sp. ZJ200 TaxID=2709792 RepID=UPI0013EDE8D0|nr:hypothetical protein [Desulfovibrio sp. ZJ200]